MHEIGTGANRAIRWAVTLQSSVPFNDTITICALSLFILPRGLENHTTNHREEIPKDVAKHRFVHNAIDN